MTAQALNTEASTLAIALRTSMDAPPVAREPVLPADLSEVYSETWREECLRRGHPHLSFADAQMRVRPALSTTQNQRCTGFDVETTLVDEPVRRRPFTISSLRHVADRAAAVLLKAQALKEGQHYFYEVVPQPTALAVDPAQDSGLVSFKMRTAPLRYLRVSLPDLLKQSSEVDQPEDGLFPVFYTTAAFKKAGAIAQRGGNTPQPIETGCVLVGSLALCDETGDCCAIIRDAIEVQDADQTKFTLSYSSRSWGSLQSILKARQTACPSDVVMFMGQAHSHPFGPHDPTVCAQCPTRPVCDLSSAFASADDQNWHRAVFAQQPWALCHIFGLSPRGDWVNRLYGLQDGRLQRRGYHVLPHFQAHS